MSGSWKLGTAFGIGIHVHWTFLLLPAWVVWSNAGNVSTAMVLFLLALLAAIFGCVVLHELGHALMARVFGIGTRDITLYPIGGVARLERMSERPGEELLIALAGPAVNVVIVGLLSVVLLLWPVTASAGMALQFVWGLWAANLILVLFNLLPAFPMDGGRVLRAFLAARLGRLRATEIAARVGVVMAILMGLAALFLMTPTLLLVAVFVFFAGQQELAATRAQAFRRHHPILDAMPAEDDEWTPRRPAGTRGEPVYVLGRDGRPIDMYWGARTE